MNITAVKTPRITTGSGTIFEVIDQAITHVAERDIIVITSKIVSICEGNVVPKEGTNKAELVAQESDFYLPGELSKYGYHFSIINNTLISMAGIDESNSEGGYILWPRDAQKTANEIWDHLRQKHGLSEVGVVITDSVSQPMRRGTIGIALAHSGFMALRDYVGTPDLFGRPFDVTRANVSGGIASAAVFAMGEGTEQTPLCVLSDTPAVVFQDHHPSSEELALTLIPPEDDIFAPFLSKAEWQPGGRKA